MIELFENKEYKELIEKISANYAKAKRRAFKAINDELILSNWETGKHIVEFEQKGKIKAEYGKKLLNKLSKDLSLLLSRFIKLIINSPMLQWGYIFEISVVLPEILCFSNKNSDKTDR